MGGESVIEIASPSGPLRAHRALPASGHGHGVLVLGAGGGLDGWLRDTADRLARAGFVALAPDLFRDEPIVPGLETAGPDLDAAVAVLLNDHAVDGGRVGVVGASLGGSLALLAAARSDRVAAVVDFYGPYPAYEVDASRIGAAVLAIFAGEDRMVPKQAVETLRSDLADARAAIRVQPEVDHDYMNAHRPDLYDAVAAAEGWDLLLAFLRAELG